MQRAPFGRPADAATIAGPVSDRLKEIAAHRLQPRSLPQLGIGGLGMAIQRLRHRADRLVMAQLQRPAGPQVMPVGPGAVEGMLQD